MKSEGSMIALTVNGKAYSLDIESETPLLWVIRDELGMRSAC